MKQQVIQAALRRLECCCIESVQGAFHLLCPTLLSSRAPAANRSSRLAFDSYTAEVCRIATCMYVPTQVISIIHRWWTIRIFGTEQGFRVDLQRITGGLFYHRHGLATDGLHIRVL